MKTIGNKIKELRRSKGMSQKDIADKLGVTSQAVSNGRMTARCRK